MEPVTPKSDSVHSDDESPAATQAGKWSRKRVVIFKFGMLAGDMAVGVGIFFTLNYLTGFYSFWSFSSVVLPVVVAIFGLILVGGYRHTTDFASLRYTSEHVIAFAVTYPLAAFLVYVIVTFGPAPTSGRWIFTTTYVGLAVYSLLIRRTYWFISSRHNMVRPFLVIVDDKSGPLFHRDYLRSGKSRPIIYASTNASLIGKEIDGPGSPIIDCSVASIIVSLASEEISAHEAVILATSSSNLNNRHLAKLGTINFEKMPVYTLLTFYQKYWERIPLQTVGPAWPLETEFMLVNHDVFTSLKRMIDIFIALVALILTSPIIALVALLVRVLDGSPVIFRQQRVGIHGKKFTMFKFRTMRVGSDKGDLYTSVGDSRITGIGGFLRKSRLDELPQLWNVLRGDMSMIGPRAEWVKLVEEYDRQITNYQFRHLVRPGITGWAQVNYPYGANLDDTLMKLSYDLFYIRNFSLRLDAEVILKTLYVMFFGKGR